MRAYDKTSIQINRCKRILALVDDYLDHTTENNRTTLRKALMEEFEAPPVAAGSVNTAPFRLLFTGHPSDADNVAEFVDVWGAQKLHEGALISLKNYDVACDDYRKQIVALTERAEKAEADASLLRNELDNLLKLATSRREWAEKAEAELKILKGGICEKCSCTPEKKDKDQCIHWYKK